jgi:hypothetical protein
MPCSLPALQGKLCWVVQCLLALLGYSKTVQRIANAPTLDEQKQLWDATLIVRFIKHGPRLLVWLFCKFVAFIMFNRIVLWWVLLQTFGESSTALMSSKQQPDSSNNPGGLHAGSVVVCQGSSTSSSRRTASPSSSTSHAPLMVSSPLATR